MYQTKTKYRKKSVKVIIKLSLGKGVSEVIDCSESIESVLIVIEQALQACGYVLPGSLTFKEPLAQEKNPVEGEERDGKE